MNQLRRYAVWFLLALAFHAGFILVPARYIERPPSYNVSQENSVEVSLVESAPAVPAQMSPPQPPDPPEAFPAASLEPVIPAQTPLPEILKKTAPAKAVEPEPELIAKEKPLRSNPAAARARPAPPAHAFTRNGTPGGFSGREAIAANGSGASKPGYLSNPRPPYPQESKANHEQGLVTLAVSIDKNGTVTSVSVNQSSGFQRLDQAAREGVSHWKFRPARAGGLAVASHLVVPVRFRLSE